MTKRTRTYRVSEGSYTAEVEVEVEDGNEPWMPWVTGEEAQKLDAVRLALRRGDIAGGRKHGTIFEDMNVGGHR